MIGFLLLKLQAIMIIADSRSLIKPFPIIAIITNLQLLKQFIMLFESNEANIEILIDWQISVSHLFGQCYILGPDVTLIAAEI